MVFPGCGYVVVVVTVDDLFGGPHTFTPVILRLVTDVTLNHVVTTCPTVTTHFVLRTLLFADVTFRLICSWLI